VVKGLEADEDGRADVFREVILATDNADQDRIYYPYYLWLISRTDTTTSDL